MLRASTNLEYEKAALLRDQIAELKAGAGLSKIEPKRQPVTYAKKGRKPKARA
jgi:excinuclease ABC subunit B